MKYQLTQNKKAQNTTQFLMTAVITILIATLSFYLINRFFSPVPDIADKQGECEIMIREPGACVHEDDGCNSDETISKVSGACLDISSSKRKKATEDLICCIPSFLPSQRITLKYTTKDDKDKELIKQRYLFDENKENTIKVTKDKNEKIQFDFSAPQRYYNFTKIELNFQSNNGDFCFEETAIAGTTETILKKDLRVLTSNNYKLLTTSNGFCKIIITGYKGSQKSYIFKKEYVINTIPEPETTLKETEEDIAQGTEVEVPTEPPTSAGS
jgi:hypothetical protein